MKPYFNVKLVGGTTYGKPVGFFPVIIDMYSVYLSGFLIRNAQGWSDYFQGMPADVVVEEQDSPVLGDPAEPCFSSVLGLIDGASVNTAQQAASRQTATVNTVFKSAPVPNLSVSGGMVENRLKLKNK
jgi:hypothetical protein